jgi:hypothetical protein
VGPLDVGAYECEDTDGDGMPDNWERQYWGGISDPRGAPLADWDNDGLCNLREYLADTNPADSNSLLQVTGLHVLPEGVLIDWKGGSNAWQYLECCPSIATSSSQWRAIFTNAPPMGTYTNRLDAGATNQAQFYRIRAERR